MVLTINTPSAQGLGHSLEKALQHGGCPSFTGARVAFEALLPVPASGVGRCDFPRSDEVVAVIVEVTSGAKGPALKSSCRR